MGCKHWVHKNAKNDHKLCRNDRAMARWICWVRPSDSTPDTDRCSSQYWNELYWPPFCLLTGIYLWGYAYLLSRIPWPGTNNLISTRLLWGLNNIVNLISTPRCSRVCHSSIPCLFRAPSRQLIIGPSPLCWALCPEWLTLHFQSINEWKKQQYCTDVCAFAWDFAYFWVFAYRWKVTKVILGASEINMV